MVSAVIRGENRTAPQRLIEVYTDTMIHTVAKILQVVSALILIAIVMSQTTKHEGMGGAIGGKAQTSFRGKAGLEEQLQKYTMYAAITFFVISILAAYTY